MFDFQQIADRSILNCHCKGVHSFVLQERDNMLDRVYVATERHELWKKDSIAFHTHRRNLSLTVLQGELFNAYIDLAKEGISIPAWKYVSKIDGEGSFERDETVHYTNYRFRKMSIGDTESMDAKMIHTVWSEQHKPCVWLIREGKLDKNYDSTCYSHANLDQFDWASLYQKPTVQEVVSFLEPYLPKLRQML